MIFLGEHNYISFIISSKDKLNTDLTNNSKKFQSLCLCTSKYVYDIFKFIPKTFKLSTNNGLEYFNIDMLKDCSSVINDFLKSNPNELQYNLDIKDEENVLGKFAQMFQGESVLFEEETLLVSFKITRLLNLKRCPNFMKPDNLRGKESTGHFVLSSKKREIKENNVEINRVSFNSFLKNQPTNTFTILTKKKEYQCNKYGVYSSKIIREIIEKDPTVDKYVYDYADEFNEFQLICDIFNFSAVEVNKNNMDSLKELIDDLQITYLSDPIIKIIENYDNFSQTVDDQQVIIDSIEEVFNWLYTIKEFSVASVRNNIIQSKWIQTEENVQELAAFILQVIKSDFLLHKYIADLLIELDKAADKTNYLKILLPFITEKLMISLGRKTTICSFVYILYKKGIISKESLISRINLVLTTNMNNENDIVSGKNTDINQINANNIYIWFLPELLTIPKYKYSIIKENNCGNQNVDNDSIQFIKSFLSDKIHLYEKMRESGEPSDPITKALRLDDVDELQNIISKTRIDISKCTIPFNIFDDFDSNDGPMKYLNYAAAHGSLRCFKYLLLNHSEIDKDTFSYAVFGGNIEIIKIVDQNKNDIKTNNTSKLFSFKIKNDSFIDKIILPAIAKHRNDLFDWIIDQNLTDASKKNSFDFNNLIISSAINGNAHSFVEIIDKGYDLESEFNTIMDLVAENGFYSLAKLLVMFMKSKLYKNSNNDVFKSKSSKPNEKNVHKFYFKSNPEKYSNNISFISFGNLSILELCIKNYNITDFNDFFIYSIKHNFNSIISYLIKNPDFDITKQMITKAFHSFSSDGKDENFKFLVDQLNKYRSEQFQGFAPSIETLNIACLNGKVEMSKTLADLIYNSNPSTDFTIPFLNAISNNEICKYFIEKKMIINVDQLTSETNFSFVTKDVLSLITLTPESKERLISCFLKLAIRNNNKDLVEYLLNENAFDDLALIEAVKSRNLDIINLVLDHYNSPSFINKRTSNGSALTIAVNPSKPIYDDDDTTLKIVNRLLSVPGIDPGIYDQANHTPLMYSVKNNNLEITNAILDFYGENLQSQIWQLNKIIKIILKMHSIKKTNNLNFSKFQHKNTPSIDEPKTTNNNNNNNEMMSILKRIVEIKGINVNCHGGKYTLLSYACFMNEINIVKYLLKSDKIDVNSYAQKTGNTPLIVAIMNENFEIAKLLIEFPQTNINISNFDNETALTIAVDRKLSQIVDLIIHNDKFDPKESRLDYAFYNSCNEISRQLLTLKSLDVNYKNVNFKNRGLHKEDTTNETIKYDTKLTTTVLSNDSELISLIIQHPSFDEIKSNLNTAIFNTVRENKIDLFKQLINKKKDVNIFKNDLSLLCFAVKVRNQEIINEILFNECFDSQKSNILRAFLLSFPSVEYMNIIYNFDKDHEKVINFKELLPNGKSFFTDNSRNDNKIMIDFRYVNGNLNADNNENNYNDCVDFLISHGADPNQPDINGIYPLQYAIKSFYDEYALALIETGKIDFTQKIKTTLLSKPINTTYLHLATENCATIVIKAMLDGKFIDINATDELGNTPLIYACILKQQRAIQYLFEKDDIDFLHKNNEGNDALRIVDPQNQKQITNKKDYYDKLLSALNRPIRDNTHNYF